jgi:hypothetical protein
MWGDDKCTKILVLKDHLRDLSVSIVACRAVAMQRPVDGRIYIEPATSVFKQNYGPLWEQKVLMKEEESLLLIFLSFSFFSSCPSYYSF